MSSVTLFEEEMSHFIRGLKEFINRNKVKGNSVNWSSKIAQISETRLMKAVIRNIKTSFQMTKICSFVPGYVRNMNLKQTRATITFLLFSWHNQSNGGMLAQLPPGARRSKHRKCGVSPCRKNCYGKTQIMETCKFF